MSSWFLLCALLGRFSLAPSPVPPRLAEADSLLRLREYMQLERWLARPGAGLLAGVSFFAGLTADTSALRGAGGSRAFPAYTLPQLTIALGSHRATLRGVQAFAQATPAPFDHFFGNLGQDVIGGDVLTLDFARMRVVLSHPSPRP